MKAIALPLCNRPTLSKRVLESLSNCLDIEKYKIVFCLEPICEETVELVNAFSSCEKEVIINKRRLGMEPNVRQSYIRAFEISDYVVCVEEDTVVSKDFLRFHQFCEEKYRDDKNVFAAIAYVYYPPDEKVNAEKQKKFINQVTLIPTGFQTWGHGLWKDRWLEVLPHWYETYDALFAKIKGDRAVVKPLVSRCINIGGEIRTRKGDPIAYFNSFNVDEINMWAETFIEV